jgi:hypothetical protein
MEKAIHLRGSHQLNTEIAATDLKVAMLVPWLWPRAEEKAQ